MTDKKEDDKRPDIVKEDHLDYLDLLRESGRVNMWGAGAYLAEEFDIGSKDANKITGYWMRSFGERN